MTDYKDDIGSLSLERGTGPSMNDEMSQRPSLDITRQQELDKGSANLERITTSIDGQLDTLLENIDIPNSQKQYLKEELIDEIYKQGGENAKVTALHYSEESGLMHAEVNHFLDAYVDVNESLNQRSTFLEQPAVTQSEESTNIPSQTLDSNIIQNEDGLSRHEQLQISQEKINEISSVYENRLSNINQELSTINEARQIEGYWEQSQEIINIDMDRAEQLLSQRQNLYEILDRTPDEQQAYLDNHPEFDLVLNERDYDKVQTTLDDLSETMPKAIKLEDNPDDYKVGVLDSVTESVGDTFTQTVDDIHEKFTNVDRRIESGDSANSNYSALGLTAQQVDQYVQEKFAEGESAEWIGLKLAGMNLLYDSWNLVTWGALKENDMLAVRHADGEISESEMKNSQYLNGGIAAAFTVTAGAGVYSRALATVSDVSLKVHIAGAITGGGINMGMQYAINGDIDMASAMIATGASFMLPAYGYKGIIGISSIGTYIDNTIIHDKSLVDTSINFGISAAANTAGYSVSYMAVNNQHIFPKISEVYRLNLYKDNGYNYIHNFTSLKDSKEMMKAAILGGALGTTTGEIINQSSVKTNEDNKK